MGKYINHPFRATFLICLIFDMIGEACYLKLVKAPSPQVPYIATNMGALFIHQLLSCFTQAFGGGFLKANRQAHSANTSLRSRLTSMASEAGNGATAGPQHFPLPCGFSPPEVYTCGRAQSRWDILWEPL